MRYIPAVPDIRMKASEGGSALLKGVDGKPSTTEHMRRQLAVFHFYTSRMLAPHGRRQNAA